jgi:hypothetical protein
MRRPVFSCLLALGLIAALSAAASASVASSRAPDDGCLVTRDVRGTVTISLKGGFVLGRFDQGQLWIDDPVEGDGTIKVTGVDKTPRLVTDTRTLYSGLDVRFRASGRSVIRIVAVGTYVSAIGKGTATVSGKNYVQDSDAGYSIDSASFCTDNFQPMPDEAAEKLVIGGTP